MGKNQPVLRLDRNGLGGKLHTKHELYPECLSVPTLGDDTANQLLDSCELEEFTFEGVSDLLDNDWSDPHAPLDAPLDALLADSLASGLDDSSTYDSSQDRSNSWPTSSSAATTVSTIGKESVTSRNSELAEVSTQPRLSSRPSLRTAVSSTSHSPVPDTAATFLSLYEETRAAYFKELRRLYEFLLNSYKSAGKTPNADGEAKMNELRGLIEFFTPKRGELEYHQGTADNLLRLRHLRDVARAYVQFYRNMRPPSSSKPPRDQELHSHRRHHHHLPSPPTDHHMLHDQVRAASRSPYYDPLSHARAPPHPHHQQPPLSLRHTASSSSRGPSLHLPMADAPATGGHPSLSKRAMLQTVAAPHMQYDSPALVPRLQGHGSRAGGSQRMRMDALKTMPALGYGAPAPQLQMQQAMGMDDLMLMQQLGGISDDQELLQGLGSKGHTLDDLDLLGIPGMGPAPGPADMQGWNELGLDDCLLPPVQNNGGW